MANKKDAEFIRVRRVPVMMTETEYLAVKRNAEEKGMTVSEYIRFRSIYVGKRRGRE